MAKRTRKNTRDLRSQEAKARDDWLLSDEGQRCLVGVAQGKYLENRLACAFSAGVEWGKKTKVINERRD